jgi:hypothetical protein
MTTYAGAAGIGGVCTASILTRRQHARTYASRGRYDQIYCPCAGRLAKRAGGDDVSKEGMSKEDVLRMNYKHQQKLGQYQVVCRVYRDEIG